MRGTGAAAVDLARSECREIGAKLLVVDRTLAFPDIEGDSENSAGAAEAAVETIQALRMARASPF